MAELTNRDQVAADAIASMIAADEQRARDRAAALEATRSWHIATIAPKAAKLAIPFLIERLGLQFYSPQLRMMAPARARMLTPSARKNRHNMLEEKLVPMFRGYWFVFFDAHRDPWQAHFRDQAVYPLRDVDSRPRQVPALLIENLRSKEINGAIDGEQKAIELGFAAGEIVRITQGPFTGFNGTIGSLDEAGRISLLVDLFGRKTPASMSLGNIEKI